VADADGRTVEPDRRNNVFAGRTIGPHERFHEVGAIAGQPARDRHSFADGADNAGNELAAIDVETVRKNKNADKVGCRQRPANFFTARARAFRRRRRFARYAQFGPIEANCGGYDFVVGDVAIANLPASTAADYVSARNIARSSR
jgi:hypothetical protein